MFGVEVAIVDVPCTCGATMYLSAYVEESVIIDLGDETSFEYDDVPAQVVPEIEEPSHCDTCMMPIVFTTSENQDGTYTIHGTCAL